MSADPVDVPKFSNEAEEADWWFVHQDDLLKQFEQAAAEGKIGVGRAKRRAEEVRPKRRSRAPALRGSGCSDTPET